MGDKTELVTRWRNDFMTTTTTKPETVTVNGAANVPPVSATDFLGAISAKPKAGKGSMYPVHPDRTGDVAKLVPIIKREDAEAEAVNGNLKIHKAELTALALPFYFETNKGRTDIPSSVACHAEDGSEILVTFESRFLKTVEPSPIIAAMGADAFGRFVYRKWEIKIDGDLIPATVAPALVPELVALFAKHGVTPALSKSEVLTATAAFMTERHSIFTPEQNTRIQQALPIRTSVKTKGRN